MKQHLHELPVVKFLQIAFLTSAFAVGACMEMPGGVPMGPIGSDFATATALKLDAEGKVKLSSSLTGSKIDVYDLGAVAPGDEVIVTITPAAGSMMDPIAAIFDVNEELFALNDDVDYPTRIDSAIDQIVHDASDHLYLGVSKYQDAGAYEGNVQILRGQAIPTPGAQFILLDFDGGTVTIPSEGDPIHVDPFNAADIDAAYAGETVAIKAKITETVRQNYERFHIQVVTTDEPAPAADCVSTIYFGSSNALKFGVAQTVDQDNRNRCDDGIVFTDGFSDPFFPQPTTEGIAIAIGNVAAHEAGHLLGLNHVADVTDLMDSTGTASTLLADQEFKTSVLVPEIFPIGKQNGPALITRVLPP
jgi:hypothetical protein